jgi:hypothetical protein
MLQVLSMMFFSLMAFSTVALLSEMLIENWREVRQALAGAAQASALPYPRPARIRRIRTRVSPGSRIATRAAA